MLIHISANRLADANNEIAVWKEGVKVMPLTLANVGENNIIRKIGGAPEV